MSFSAKDAKPFGLSNDEIHPYQHLAFHYVAAVLNGLNNGGILPSELSEIGGYLDRAVTIFTNNPDMLLSPSEEAEANDIASILGSFNEGKLYDNWPHCEDPEALTILEWIEYIILRLTQN